MFAFRLKSPALGRRRSSLERDRASNSKLSIRIARHQRFILYGVYAVFLLHYSLSLLYICDKKEIFSYCTKGDHFLTNFGDRWGLFYQTVPLFIRAVKEHAIADNTHDSAKWRLFSYANIHNLIRQ